MGEPASEEKQPDSNPTTDDSIPLEQYQQHNNAEIIARDGSLGHRTIRRRSSIDDINRYSTDELTAYDLRPPPPSVSDANAEAIASRLWSPEHLDVILQDPQHSGRFRSFLKSYQPHLATTLARYVEAQKALAAIRYANSLADVVSSGKASDPQQPSQPASARSDAAVVDTKFQNFSQKAMDELVTEALPSFITYCMMTIVTESLVKDITRNNSPYMRDLVQGLAEVYCMSDPNQPDNPLVFASEEFYNTTQYNHEYVIGKNCRFLQGPATSRVTTKRIANALRNGQETNEIILNYRRDGSSFLNLLMTAPLMDQRGNIRYHIGAQIDITRLLEGGKGLESFRQLLAQEREAGIKAADNDSLKYNPSLKMLHELGVLLDDEEVDVVRQPSTRRRLGSVTSVASTPARGTPTGRRYIGTEEAAEDSIWPPSKLGPQGRLPGVYQNYLLVRPFPSLRIIFTSPALRIPGLCQSKLMDRIGGPQHICEGLLEALTLGTSVTAKVSWLTHSTHSTLSQSATSDPNAHIESRPRWIHCTPLMGSDLKPGVYMIVMVDKEEITGTLNARSPPMGVVRSVDLTKDVWPWPGIGRSGATSRAGKFSSSQMYADYLKREGSTASESAAGRRKMLSPNRASLEEDIRLGRVGAGLARVSPTMGSPTTMGSVREFLGEARESPVQSRQSGRYVDSRQSGRITESKQSGRFVDSRQSDRFVDAIPYREHPASRQSVRQSIDEKADWEEEEDLEAVPVGVTHGHNISMDVGAPTPSWNRSQATDLNVLAGES